MIYPQHIVETFRKIKELEDIGFEEQATTCETKYLNELEREIWRLEAVLNQACEQFELEDNGEINMDRWYDLSEQYDRKTMRVVRY